MASKSLAGVISSKMLSETFNEMLKSVPLNEDSEENATENFIAAVLAAENPAELDAAWNGGGDLPTDVEITITKVTQIPSDYKESLGVFLVVWYTETVSGFSGTATTGSIPTVAQLVKACAMGALPLKVVPRVAARPTRNGYYPQHLEVVK